MSYYKCRRCGAVKKSDTVPLFCGGPSADGRTSLCYGVMDLISDERGLAHEAGFKL